MLTFIKMKKPFEQIIEIPEGVEVTLDGPILKVKGPEGENSREFKLGKIKFEIKDKKITMSDKQATKREIPAVLQPGAREAKSAFIATLRS